MTALRIGVAGAAGRMGREIISTVLAEQNNTVILSAALESSQNAAIGGDAGVLAGVGKCDILVNTIEKLGASPFDVLIDFSTPATTVSHADFCAAGNMALVIGVTGFGDEQKKRIQSAAQKIALVMSPNMSLGVNALFALADTAARLLKAGRLGGGYDMEVFEAHHRRKKDAPSGTALRLGETLANATGTTLKQNAVFDRQGLRDDNDIGFSVVRGGDIVGEHRVIFAGGGEQLELIHRSTSRANYAAGAVQAAKFAATADAGLYDMTPVINMPA